MIKNFTAPRLRPGFWSLALAVTLATAGCSITDELNERGRIDYKSAGKLPQLDVPPDLINPAGDDRFAIPERAQRDRTFSSYQTARTTERPVTEARVLQPAEGMRIERAGGQRWLVVNQPVDKIWPVLREFWQESGFAILTENPATGVMETDWAENRAKIPQDIIRRTVGRLFESAYSSAERDKFRTRLEAAPSGTEIYLSHRGMVEEWTSERRESTVWRPRPSDPELEAEFLRRLMVRLGADAERAKELVASAQPVVQTTRIVEVGGVQRVEVREGFDRAWRRVGLALDRGGFTVEDRDRSQGVYFVRYIDPEVDSSGGKPGFFSRLFSRDSKASSAQQYRVKLAASGDATEVTVLAKDGQALASEIDRKTGSKILALLRDQLQQ